MHNSREIQHSISPALPNSNLPFHLPPSHSPSPPSFLPSALPWFCDLGFRAADTLYTTRDPHTINKKALEEAAQKVHVQDVHVAWYMCTHTPDHPSIADGAWYWPKHTCTLGDCLASRPEGYLRPRELWFLIYSCTMVYMHMYIPVLCDCIKHTVCVYHCIV